MSLLSTFASRHLLEATTSPDLEKMLEKPLTVYAGFDPTSDSLQAGNFVTIMALASAFAASSMGIPIPMDIPRTVRAL